MIKDRGKKEQSFINGADEDQAVLDAAAKREFKKINVPFNEFEYRELERLAKKLNRSKLNLIRFAILELGKNNPD